MPETATELLERPADETAVTETGVTGTGLTETDATVAETPEVIAADLLVEEVSIDGMCGVY
jgi:mycofactocin precursor